MAGNRFLLRTMRLLHEMLRQGMETTLSISGRRACSLLEHRRILRPIAAGDPVAARRAMREHITSAQHVAVSRPGSESRRA